MNPVEAVLASVCETALVALLDMGSTAVKTLLGKFIEKLGPDIVKAQADEWVAARAESNLDFETKFGQKP